MKSAIGAVLLGLGIITHQDTTLFATLFTYDGTLTYTFNGTQVVKAITRQVFSSPASLCN